MERAFLAVSPNSGSWNYRGQDAGRSRHYGPMAQEFYAAFGKDGVGTIGNDTTLASADVYGVQFIGIQALEKRTAELRAENQQLGALKEQMWSDIAELKKSQAHRETKADRHVVLRASAVSSR
jgi:hypothetical protein